MLRKLTTYIFFLCLSLISLTIHAQQEQILNFDSHIIVNKNASIDVTENILVHANQDKILHGIVRRLPMEYLDNEKIKRLINYQIQTIFSNQQSISYHIEHSNDELAIYIGNLDVMLSAGDYLYTIHYHVNNAISFLKDTDELYWNVTGNELDFPLRKAQVSVQLPPDAKISSNTAYTGKTHDVSAVASVPNQITFTTTRPLDSGEGFVVNVSWQKGVVVEPTWLDRSKAKLPTTRTLYIIPIVIIFILLSGLLFIRIRSQRKNRKKKYY